MPPRLTPTGGRLCGCNLNVFGGFGVWGFGFLGFRVWGLGLKFWGLGYSWA